MSRVSTILVLAFLLLLLIPQATANLRVYKDCNPSHRSYMSNRFEDALSNIELVARARESIKYKLEDKHFGVLDQAQKDKVTDVYTRALRNRPTLLFTCPRQGSELEKMCQASKGSAMPDLMDDRIGIALMETIDYGIVACSAPEAGADFSFANKVAIVKAIIETTLKEQQKQDHMDP